MLPTCQRARSLRDACIDKLVCRCTGVDNSDVRGPLSLVPEDVTVLEDAEKGRVLVASRDFAAGDTVFCEEPLLFVVVDEFPGALARHCLFCAKPCDRPGVVPCSGTCNHKFCSQQCAKKHKDVHVLECHLLTHVLPRLEVEESGSSQDTETTFQMQARTRARADALFVVRAAALRATRPERWAAMLQLAGHSEARARAYPARAASIRNAAGRIAGILKESTRDSRFSIAMSPRDCERVLDIVAVNGVRLQLHDQVSVIAIYSGFCMLEHSCIPNCLHQPAEVRPDGSGQGPAHVVLRCRAKVKKDEHLSITYVPLDQPLIRRQRQLILEKCFSCGCRRCQDPSEINSDLAALRCKCGGLLCPPAQNACYFLSAIPKAVGTNICAEQDAAATSYSCRCGATLSVSMSTQHLDSAAAALQEAVAAASNGGPGQLDRLRELRRRCDREPGGAVFAAYLCDVHLGALLVRSWEASALLGQGAAEVAAREALKVQTRALEIAKLILPSRDPQLQQIWNGIAKCRLVLLRSCKPLEMHSATEETLRSFLQAAEQARVCFGVDSRRHQELKVLAEEMRKSLMRMHGR